MPLPNPEPIGLPAPVWLLQSLLVLTFSLHLIPMTFTLGGSLVALVHELLGLRGRQRYHRQLARRLWGLLPVVTAFTITLGVAPFLFLQLVYGKFFYPASILTGWSWFAVVPLLIVGYGCLYLQAMALPEARWRPLAGIASVASFLAIAGIYVSTMSLSTAPEAWKAMYAASQSGLHGYFQLGRWAHVVTGAIVMAGGLTGLLGHLTAHDLGFGRFARRAALVWMGLGLLLGAPAGFVYLAALSASAQSGLVPALYWAAGALGLVGFAALLAGERARRSLPAGWLGLGAPAAGAVLLAVQRHLVRQAVLAPNITAADWKLQPQWDVFVLFALLLVGSLGLIGYLVRRWLLSARAVERQYSHTAD